MKQDFSTSFLGISIDNLEDVTTQVYFIKEFGNIIYILCKYLGKQAVILKI